jgi:hypothetical protein
MGFEARAVLSDDEMKELIGIHDQDPNVTATPAQELRYIEGLFDLPMGYIKDFKVIAKAGYEKCQCGRVPTALDIVHYGLRRNVHPKELMRNTLTGFANIFEMSDDGRTADCYNCGRKIIIMTYHTARYLYC